jgi:hypothetical protein
MFGRVVLSGILEDRGVLIVREVEDWCYAQQKMRFLQDRHQSDGRRHGMESECEGIKFVLRITSSDGFVHYATQIQDCIVVGSGSSYPA